MKKNRVPSPVTQRQAEYLAFIHQYCALMDRAPTEADIADFFGVSGPSAHQMVVTLEKKSLLHRLPGVARGIRLVDLQGTLPILGGPGYVGDDPAAAVTAFAAYLAQRVALRNREAFSTFVAATFIAERLGGLLAPFDPSDDLLKKAHAAILQAAGVRLRLRRARRGSTAHLAATQPTGVERPSLPGRKPRPRKPVPPGQGNLF